MPEHNELTGRQPLFPLGRTVATPAALVALTFNQVSPQMLLHRHRNGDWGDLSEEDKQLNDQAVKDGSRILSAYVLADGTRVWVLTEGDRSASTILLPEEY